MSFQGYPCPRWGYPSHRQGGSLFQIGGTLVLDYLLPAQDRTGVPLPPPQTEQQNKYLLRGGRYASCLHAGGLSCFVWSSPPPYPHPLPDCSVVCLFCCDNQAFLLSCKIQCFSSLQKQIYSIPFRATLTTDGCHDIRLTLATTKAVSGLSLSRIIGLDNLFLC